MFGRTESKRRAGHANESNWQGRNFGTPGLVADGYPHIARRLDSKVVKSECGEQANNAFGDLIRRLDERGVFAGRKQVTCIGHVRFFRGVLGEPAETDKSAGRRAAWHRRQ